MAIRRFLFVTVCSTSAAAFAQAPAGVSTSTLPAHNCVRPDEPGRLATTNQLKIYSKEEQTYRDCLQAFVKSQSELVKLHTAAGNVVIKEYNDYVTELKKKREEAAK